VHEKNTGAFIGGGEALAEGESPISPLESSDASMLFSPIERRIRPIFVRLR